MRSGTGNRSHRVQRRALRTKYQAGRVSRASLGAEPCRSRLGDPAVPSRRVVPRGLARLRASLRRRCPQSTSLPGRAALPGQTRTSASGLLFFFGEVLNLGRKRHRRHALLRGRVAAKLLVLLTDRSPLRWRDLARSRGHLQSLSGFASITGRCLVIRFITSTPASPVGIKCRVA